MKKIFDYPEEAPPTIKQTINFEANQLAAFWLFFLSVILYIIGNKVNKYKKNKGKDLTSVCRI